MRVAWRAAMHPGQWLIEQPTPMLKSVVHAEPYANVVSYGVMPTLIAFVRFPVATDTRLTVDVLVSSIHIEPAP